MYTSMMLEVISSKSAKKIAETLFYRYLDHLRALHELSSTFDLDNPANKEKLSTYMRLSCECLEMRSLLLMTVGCATEKLPDKCAPGQRACYGDRCVKDILDAAGKEAIAQHARR